MNRYRGHSRAPGVSKGRRTPLLTLRALSSGRFAFVFLWAIVPALVLAQHHGGAPKHAEQPAEPGKNPTKVAVYAEGLFNPKGMAFTADGTMYIAESGKPGDVMVPLPVNFGGKGPIGTNGRISRVKPGGKREDVVTHLPNVGLYGGIEMLGPTGLAVLDGQLYEVAAGHMTVSPLLSRLSPDGKMTKVADLGAYNKEHPADPSNGDAVPLGNSYAMVALDGNLYITDGNYNRVLKATPKGDLSIFAKWDESPVTVGAAAGPDGCLYVTQFSPAPYSPGSGRVDKVAPDGTITEGAVRGLTTPIAVDFAPDGTMYVLQYAATFNPEKSRYDGNGGQVQRVGKDGRTTPVVTNLMFPTAMIFGPDGALYVANYGNEANDGQGQVLRVVPGDSPTAGPHFPLPEGPGYSAKWPKPAPPPPGTKIAGRINVVEVGDSSKWGFEPNPFTMQAGEAVEFYNGGKMYHNASDKLGRFDTGMMKHGETVAIRINEPGTYHYFCAPHPWMKGTIIVEGQGPQVAPPTAPRPEEPPPSISIWKASLFVGGIIAAVFVAGFFMRRRSPAEPA